MAEAYIYDHVRSPRGRGRPNGALHQITPVELTTQVLEAIRDRNELNTALLDDVVLGCVAPVGEQGANIARVAALNADYDQQVPGKQLNRFCASGLEAINTAAAQISAYTALRSDRRPRTRTRPRRSIGGFIICARRFPG